MDNEVVSPYAYTPVLSTGHANSSNDGLLPSTDIRILELLPAKSRDAQLHGILHIEPILVRSGAKRKRDRSHDDHTPSQAYEAVSYAWGDTSKPCYIDIEGRRLAIGKAADEALRHFRKQTESRRLWIDAICINQNDNEERTSQVSIMINIFKKATQTLAWLGEDTSDEGGLASIAFCEWCANQDLINWPQFYESGLGSLIKTINLYNENNTAGKHVELRQLETFFRRPYFSRRWIVQEIGVARTVELWCGERCLSGSQFRSVMESLITPDSPFSVSDDFMRLGTMRMRSMLKHELPAPARADTVMDMIEAMEKFRGFKCRDARDRIASLTWISEDFKDFHVKYSATTEANYMRFAVTSIKIAERSAPYVLASAARRLYAHRSPDNTLLSWVPDWRVDPVIGKSTVFCPREKPEIERNLDWFSDLIRVRVLCVIHESRVDAKVEGDGRLILHLENVYCHDNAYVSHNFDQNLHPADVILNFAYPNDRQSGDNFISWGRCSMVLRKLSELTISWRIIGTVQVEPQWHPSEHESELNRICRTFAIL